MHDIVAPYPAARRCTRHVFPQYRIPGRRRPRASQCAERSARSDFESRHSRLSAASSPAVWNLFYQAARTRLCDFARADSVDPIRGSYRPCRALLLKVWRSISINTSAKPGRTSPPNRSRRLLGRGFPIGAHSHDHPRYADIPLPEQLAQTRMSVELLETRFGMSPKGIRVSLHGPRSRRCILQTRSSQGRYWTFRLGQAGLVSHFHSRNIERMSMEKTLTPAAQVLALGNLHVRPTSGLRPQ